MAVTFEVETGTQSATANSFASVANGDDYHAKHLYSEAWDDADTTEKQEALMMSTRLLDNHMQFEGIKASQTQALQWPRHGASDQGGYAIDGDEIPQILIDATAELARLLLIDDRTAESPTMGFSRMKADVLDVDVDKFDRRPIIPGHIADMLAPIGLVAGRTTGILVRA